MGWFNEKQVIEVKAFKIKKPKKDELLIFHIPDGNIKIIKNFKDVLSKAMKNEKSTMICVGEMTLIKAKKKQIEVKE